ncbi:MAG: 2OG-Fe(II) oxygenase [Acidimicrobiales bacterium]|nr:2OG-Fe(II) oxygenase [Acidimicrobiales bacterium]
MSVGHLDDRLSSLIDAAVDQRDGADEELATELRRRAAPPGTPGAPGVLERWSDVPVADLAQHADAFAEIHRGDRDGLLIRGVLSPDEAAAFTLRVMAPGLLHDNVGGALLGTSLLGLPERDGYYREAHATRRTLDELFGFSFEDRIEAVLEAVGGGRRARLPQEGPDQTYLPATVRVLHPRAGGYRSHTGNEFVESYASYDHLRSIARTVDALSYFVVTQKPDQGGELVLYDLRWDETPDVFRTEFMTPVRDARLEAWEKASVDPEPGDMILFNGGRIWHKVADIDGGQPRVTVGGFSTLAADGASIYYWN